MLGIGDIRAGPQGEAGGRLEMAYLPIAHWQVSISGHFGGSWFDFGGGPFGGEVGKIENVAWSVRGGVDHLMSLGGRHSLFLGAGFEYGEGRSWLHALTPSRMPISDQGPHAFLVGGSLRMGWALRLAGRQYLCAQILEGLYRAHARDTPLWQEYNWLGRSMAVTLGYRYAVLAGRSERSAGP